MRRFELLIARERIGLLSAMDSRPTHYCVLFAHLRGPLCHICSMFD
jgi:hypothetical protein